MLFGGPLAYPKVTYKLTEDGKLRRDYCNDELIHVMMCYLAYTIKEGRVFALVERQVNTGVRIGIDVFEGK